MALDIAEFETDDARDFLQELIDHNELEGAALGVAKKVIGEKGVGGLSDAQRYALTAAVGPHVFSACQRCGGNIPWSEMYAAADNGHLCNWCHHMSQKDD